MAGRADAAETRLAGRRQRRVGLDARQALHVGRHFGDADVAADRRRQRRHGRLPALQDGRQDLVGRTAPQPVFVGEVGITLGAARVGAVAHGAVVGVDRRAVGHRLGITRDVVDRLAFVAAEGIGKPRVGRGLVQVVFAGRGPARPAGEVAHARIPGQVADGEDDGDVEQVDPPLGQRLVVFGQVAVPDVAGGGGRVLVGGAAARRPPQQPHRGHDVQDDQGDDVEGPAGAHGVFSFWSSRGRRAAASNSGLRLAL